MNKKAVCFTGHRPKDLFGYYNTQPWTALRERLERHVLSFVDKGITTFISGGAQGVDQAAFWAVQDLKKKHPELGLSNHLYLPWDGYGMNWKGNGIFSFDQLKRMILLADEVKFCTSFVNEGVYREICDALFTRNHRMVDNSCAVIGAFTKGDYHTAKSGTAECLRYAESKGLDLDIFNPLS